MVLKKSEEQFVRSVSVSANPDFPLKLTEAPVRHSDNRRNLTDGKSEESAEPQITIPRPGVLPEEDRVVGIDLE